MGKDGVLRLSVAGTLDDLRSDLVSPNGWIFYSEYDSFFD